MKADEETGPTDAADRHREKPTPSSSSSASGSPMPSISALRFGVILLLMIVTRMSSKTVSYSSDVCRNDPVSVLYDEIHSGPAFMDIIIPTVTRPAGATFLIETLGTLVQVLPIVPGVPLFGRVRVHVINQNKPGKPHAVFDAAKTLFAGMNASLFFHDRPAEFFTTPFAPPSFPQQVDFQVHPDWAASIWKVLQLGGSYLMIAVRLANPPSPLLGFLLLTHSCGVCRMMIMKSAHVRGTIF